MLSKYAATYAATAIVMVLLDLLWLGIIAKPIYQQGIGHLMAEQPRLGVAVAFYLMFALAIVVFAVAPNEGNPGIARTAITGALFGFFAYATYDLTNLATLKNWPVAMSLMDMAWGSFVSAASAVSGKWMLDRFAGG
jgi:uncharacterized membrane protein